MKAKIINTQLLNSTEDGDKTYEFRVQFEDDIGNILSRLVTGPIHGFTVSEIKGKLEAQIKTHLNTMKRHDTPSNAANPLTKNEFLVNPANGKLTEIPVEI